MYYLPRDRHFNRTTTFYLVWPAIPKAVRCWQDEWTRVSRKTTRRDTGVRKGGAEAQARLSGGKAGVRMTGRPHARAQTGQLSTSQRD